MENGKWKIDNGEWRIENEKRKVESEGGIGTATLVAALEQKFSLYFLHLDYKYCIVSFNFD